MFYNLAETPVLLQKLERRLGSNTLDRFEVITAKKDTEFNKLAKGHQFRKESSIYGHKPDSCPFLVLQEQLSG